MPSRSPGALPMTPHKKTPTKRLPTSSATPWMAHATRLSSSPLEAPGEGLVAGKGG